MSYGFITEKDAYVFCRRVPFRETLESMRGAGVWIQDYWEHSAFSAGIFSGRAQQEHPSVRRPQCKLYHVPDLLGLWELHREGSSPQSFEKQ